MIAAARIACIILFIPFLCIGQSRARLEKMYDKALEAYRLNDYSAAKIEIGRITALHPSYLPACLLMADICHDEENYTEEMIWLRKSSEIPGTPTLVHYRMGDACFRTGNYSEGLESLNRLDEKDIPASLREKTEKLRAGLRFASEAVKNPVRFMPVKLDSNINTPDDEYWPSITVDNNILVFTRLLPGNDHSFLKQEDFYFSRFDSAGWKPAVPISGINTPNNEGAQSISADGKLLFFTLCNHPEGYGSCDIWFSRMENGTWSLPGNAGEPVNTPGWEGQPSFSAFGNTLYFSSARPGGKGNKDVWSIQLKGWDQQGYPVWTRLKPLGDSINSPGDEISPFIHPNGKDLYFSSDGWPGFGGLDLFHAIKKENETWSSPSNLGYPVNSYGNEQGLVIDRKGTTAYFATNSSSKGNMDIFSFETDEAFRPEAVSYIRGKVVNALTGLPVIATVAVHSGYHTEKEGFEIKADENGIFLITLPPEDNVFFSVNEKGYLFYSERFDPSKESSASQPLERLIRLVPAEPGTTVTLYNIFFTTGEYAILPESEPELKTLLSFLVTNPHLTIEIGGHTDNVGSAEFNLKLSEKRADSVKQYLEANGIGENRLSVKGYGMTQPVATNDNAEGRARNRRTTIRIIR